ncbi:Hypothetical predicted protein [Olea europaea subsp. europaea]|uniref:Uncharacterized protein n=1 Tax=Olea europaea subsp. europaea TaxID=158383 RepID=A0A8S0RKT4_OLEEU|nr:Hypothetical predicted protein [Olea europaea subsp. europaea]
MRIGARDCLVSDDAMECANWIIPWYNASDVRTRDNENANSTQFSFSALRAMPKCAMKPGMVAECLDASSIKRGWRTSRSHFFVTYLLKGRLLLADVIEPDSTIIYLSTSFRRLNFVEVMEFAPVVICLNISSGMRALPEWWIFGGTFPWSYIFLAVEVVRADLPLGNKQMWLTQGDRREFGLSGQNVESVLPVPCWTKSIKETF